MMTDARLDLSGGFLLMHDEVLEGTVLDPSTPPRPSAGTRSSSRGGLPSARRPCGRARSRSRPRSTRPSSTATARRESPGLGHRAKATVPRLLCQGYCAEAIVPRLLCQGYYAKATVPRLLCQGYCAKATVPRRLCQGCCAKATVPRLLC
jgi:hypothetical protein